MVAKYGLIKQSTVQKRFGVELLEQYLKKELGEFFAELPSELEDTAGVMSDDDLSTLHEQAGNGSVKLIDLTVNSYNRVFIYYLSTIDGLYANSSEQEVRQLATKKGFEDFMSAFSSTDNGKKINRSSGIRSKVDFVINAEVYATDLKKIPELANKDTQSALKDCVWLYNNMYRDYHTDETKAIVEQIYAQDIQTYGYTF